MKKLFLFFIITLTVVTAKAQYLSIGNLKYYITDDYGYTVECVGLSSAGESANPTEIDLPGKINYGGSTYTVTDVKDYAFSGNTRITVLKVCHGVTSIGYRAFSGCTSLKYVYLPSSVTLLDNYSFANTSSMMQFNYASQSVPTFYSGTFSGMRSASLVVSTFEAKTAFSSNSTFSSAFSSINANGRGAYDFTSGSGCYVVIGSNTCMLVGLLSNTPSIPVSATNNDNYTYGGLTSPEYYKVTVAAPRLAELSEKQSSLTSFTWLGSEAKKIGISAFQGCTALTTVKVSADTLDNYAFYNCPAITTLQLYETGSEYNGVKRINSMAFAYDHGLVNVYIPSSVIYMAEGGNMPFYMCNNLEKYTVSSSNQYYASSGYSNLYNKSLTKLIHMPRNGGGTNYSYFLSGYQMEQPSTLTEIGDYACYYHNKLQQVVLNYGVKTIGNNAFANCDKLTYMLIPSSVTNYKTNSFYGLYSLTDLYLNRDNYPSQLADLVNRANINLHVPYPMVNYYKNTSLGSSFKSVDGNAWDIYSGYLFFTVTSTEPYSDPNNTVNYDGGQAKLVHGQSVYVNSKYNLYDIQISHSLNVGGDLYCPTAIEKNYYQVLKQNSSTENIIYYGHTIKEVEDSAFYNCQNLKISNGSLDHLKTIGKAAFSKTTNLTSMSFSDVEVIKEYAFDHSGLSGDIELPKIRNVGLNAFFYCPGITSMTFYGEPYLSTACFGYNASNCLYYVDASQYYRLTHQQYTWYISDDMTTADERMRPFVKLDNDTRIFSCHKSVEQPAGGSFYTIPSYDASKNRLNTSKWNGAIPASTAMLMKGSKGQVYKFKNLGTSTATPTNMLMPVINDYFVNTVGGYLYNEQTHQFDYDTGNEVSPYSTIEPSYGYLSINTLQNHVNIDLFSSSSVPGDVNGDGTVTAADITALYDYMLNNDSSHITNGDQTGDGIITAADITAVYTIMLGSN